MANVMKTYLRHMSKKYGYHAIWQPNRGIKVGDVVKFHRGITTIYTTLKALEVKPKIRKRETTDTIDYTSNSSVKVVSKVKAETNEAFKVLGKGDAGFSVSFGRSRSILFKALDITYHEIINLQEIEQSIPQLQMAGKWDDDYCIITEVVEARGATILISNSRDSSIELKAKAEGTMDIANPSLELDVVIHQGIETKIVAEGGITPLYRMVSLNKDGLFNPVKDAKFEGDILQEIPFEAIDFDKD